MFERNTQGAVDVISGGDRISGDHVGELDEMFDACVGQGQPHVVLDLQEVALIDGAGLELLLEVQDRYRRMGGALKLANASSLLREIFKVTGVGARFEMFGDARSAVRSFVS
jgi:anti-anti-sigma factor